MNLDPRRLSRLWAPDVLFSLTGLDHPSAEDVASVQGLRRKLNASSQKGVSAVGGILVLVQLFVILADGAIAARPAVQDAYLALFFSAFLVSALMFVVWTIRPQTRGQTLYIIFVLADGIGLTLCDLQMSGDYSTYVLVLFGAALLYSAPLTWYLVAFAASWGALVTGIALTAPFPLGATAAVGSAVLTIVGMVAGLILEVRRVRTELLALELGRKTQEWKEASLRDSLTGLWNRRFLYEWMGKQSSLARRADHPLAVALLDLDHFKAINDTAGHHTGDEALKRAADWLTSTVRESDVTARFGGEEFLVVLPETSLEGAEAVVGRCLEVFRSSRVPGWDRPLTFSAGLTLLGPKETVKDLFQRVDGLLYRAKGSGRNQIVTG